MTNSEELTESSVESDLRFRMAAEPTLFPSLFMSALSHELCTPLGSILMISEMMLDQVEGDPAKSRQAHMIHQAALDLKNLIEQASLLARIREGRLQLHKEEIATEVLAGDLRQEFRNRHQNVRVELAPEAPTTQVTDRPQLVDGIRRLLVNIQEEEGAAKVAFEADPRRQGALRIRVWRPTSGVTKEQLGSIFEPFHPAARIVRRSHGGQSLDLTIARAVVELLGATISADLGAEGAVVFSLSLH